MRKSRKERNMDERIFNREKYLAKIAWRYPYLDDTCEEWTKGTYWGEDGTYQDLSEQLHELVPSSGSVDCPEQNPKLEKFRKMSNAYYDLYNNGGTNTGRKTAYYFPRTVTYAKQMRWNRCYEITEPKMDRAILQAGKEQGLV